MQADPRVNILLVDDEPANLHALQAVLEPLEQNLITASSGTQALRQVLEHDFAVILLDVQMPDMSGIEAAAMIRERERSKTTPIIFLTGVVQDRGDDVQRLLGRRRRLPDEAGDLRSAARQGRSVRRARACAPLAAAGDRRARAHRR